MDNDFFNIVAALQNTVTKILSNDSILSSMGAEFASENALDIEFQVGKALKQQGLACMVMTPKMTYQGHNGAEQVWTVDDLRVQCVENPIVNRARLKKEGKTAGTALDVAVQVQRRLAGPQGGNYGRFTSKGIEQKEMDGLLVAEAIFQCTIHSDVPPTSCDISGNWCEIPYIRISDLSDFIDDYLSTHIPAVEGFLPLSGGAMSGDITFQSNNGLFWGDQDNHDAYIMGGSMGLAVYNDADEQWRFKSSSLPESEDDVLRRRDLSAVDVPTKVSELSNDVGFVTSADVVMRNNTSPLTVTVPYDYGFSLQTPNGIALLKTIDLNRTAIESLSAGNVEVGTNGSVVRYTGDGETPLSAWNWLKTNSRGLGDLISSEHNSILGEVGEDFVSFNWFIQQGYVTSGEISAKLGQYLPLSGGQMEGGIGWDYGGSGGPRIDGPWSPQQLAFSTTFSDDQGKHAFLDFGRISANGQYTIAYVEDIDAALGDLSALIHAT